MTYTLCPTKLNRVFFYLPVLTNYHHRCYSQASDSVRYTQHKVTESLWDSTRQARMAQHQNRSNHVRVDNLPPNMADCRELLSQLELGGNVQ